MIRKIAPLVAAVTLISAGPAGAAILVYGTGDLSPTTGNKIGATLNLPLNDLLTQKFAVKGDTTFTVGTVYWSASFGGASYSYDAGSGQVLATDAYATATCDLSDACVNFYSAGPAIGVTRPPSSFGDPLTDCGPGSPSPCAVDWTGPYNGPPLYAFLSFDGTALNANSKVYVAFGDADVALLSGVPEPATWAMMIVGFGLAGSALRRRHSYAAMS